MLIFRPPSQCGITAASRLGSFPAFWRQANVTPIPKGQSSSSVPSIDRFPQHPSHLRYLSVWWLVSDDLLYEVESVQPLSLLIGMVWVLVMHILCASHSLLRALESEQDAVYCGLTSAQPLIRSTIREFYIRSATRVLEVVAMVDDCQSKLVNVMTGVLQSAGQCFRPVIVPPIQLGACCAWHSRVLSSPDSMVDVLSPSKHHVSGGCDRLFQFDGFSVRKMAIVEWCPWWIWVYCLEVFQFT